MRPLPWRARADDLIGARRAACLTPLGVARRPPISRRSVGSPSLVPLLGLADRVWPPLVAAALTVAVGLALTGLLHLDGLIDSADSLLAPMPCDRRLAVMCEPTIGAFGVVAAVAVCLLRFSASASLEPSVSLLAGSYGAQDGDDPSRAREGDKTLALVATAKW